MIPSLRKRISIRSEPKSKAQLETEEPKRRVSFTSVSDSSSPKDKKSSDEDYKNKYSSLKVRVNRKKNFQDKLTQKLSPITLGHEIKIKDTVLHDCVMKMDLEEMKKALHVHVNEINYRATNNGLTVLMMASDHIDKEKSVSMCKLLLEYKASLNVVDYEGHSCLHWAAAAGNIELIRIFCNLGADINQANFSNETALHRACRFGQVNSVNVLIQEYQANYLIYDKNFLQPFDVAGRLNSGVNKDFRKNIQKSIIQLDDSFKTLILHHPDCLLHDTMTGHQESPNRLISIINTLENIQIEYGAPLMISSDFEAATFEMVSKAHFTEYVEFLEELDRQVKLSDQPIPLTPRLQIGLHGKSDLTAKPKECCDTNFSKGTFAAAMRAAGAVCHAIDQVVLGKNRNAFCLVRPPGHHAGASGLLTDSVSCGFCILNNVVVGASHALDTYPDIIKRVAIIDIDCHHGNGTVDIIDRRIHKPENIFFASIHLYDEAFYPGTGKKDDLPLNVMNSAVRPLWQNGSKLEVGQGGFKHHLQSRVLPALRAFNPDLILISIGFDGCKHDIGNKQCGQRRGRMGLDLLPSDFFWMTAKIKQVAAICCNNRIVSVLEGGYGKVTNNDPKCQELDLSDFKLCALGHIDALASHITRPAEELYLTKNLNKGKSKQLKECETSPSETANSTPSTFLSPPPGPKSPVPFILEDAFKLDKSHEVVPKESCLMLDYINSSSSDEETPLLKVLKGSEETARYSSRTRKPSRKVLENVFENKVAPNKSGKSLDEVKGKRKAKSLDNTPVLYPNKRKSNNLVKKIKENLLNRMGSSGYGGDIDITNVLPSRITRSQSQTITSSIRRR